MIDGNVVRTAMKQVAAEQQVIEYIRKASSAQISKLIPEINARREYLMKEAVHNFAVGDKVVVRDKKHGKEFRGVVKEVRIKKLLITFDNGVDYKVPAIMVEKVEQ